MAGLEVAAGALGIIGVSQQVAQSARKIRAFCKDVQEAPTELRELTQSLETLSRILIRLGEVVAATSTTDQVCPDVDLLRESLQTCQHIAERTSVFVGEAHQNMGKRRYRGSCAFVMKKRELKAMLEKLDRSKSDLSIALAIFACPAAQKRANFLVGRQTSSQKLILW